MKNCFALILVLFTGSVQAAPNVILITVDGLRYQEFFDGVKKPRKAKAKRGRELLPLLKARAKNGQAWLYSDMKISNKRALSLPGYRSIMTGQFESRCKKNTCSNIDRETVFDALVNQGFTKEQLAVFASWNVIGQAVESVPGRITRNIEFTPFWQEGLTNTEQNWLQDLNSRMMGSVPPWGGSRWDEYTYLLGNFYLRKHQPRFLYLSFVDTDEFAHQKNYKGYVNAIREFDHRLDHLVNTLETMGEYGDETSIIITTDHGRSPWFLWSKHSAEFSTARKVWAVVIPSKKLLAEKGAQKRKQDDYKHIQIRPTIEALLGVPYHGQPIVNFTYGYD